MWLFALVACFDPAARPYAAYEEELLDVTDTASEFTACSDPVGSARLVLFANESEDPVELWYIAPSCEADLEAEIAATGTVELSVAQGDVYRFRRPGEAFSQEVLVDGVSLYYGFAP